MSFREKTAWISLLSMSIIYGLYFASVYKSGLRASFNFGGLLGTVIALVIVQVAATTAVAIFSAKEAKAPADERDKMIDLKSTRLAYGVLAGCIACACFFAGFNPPIIFNPNALLFILVATEILRSGCQIFQYRRSA